MRRLLAAATAVAALSAGGGAAAKGPGLFAVAEWRAGKWVLALRDADTLKPVGSGTLPLPYAGAFAFSPDRRSIAIATGNGGLRLFDLTRWRAAGRLPAHGFANAVLWPRHGRLLALSKGMVIAADVRGPSVRSWDPQGGQLRDTATFARRLLLLLSPDGDLGGAPTLVVVEPTGATRSVRLARSGGRPVLAVDPAGSGRAFVLARGHPAAVIDLRTLSVRYHELADRTIQRALKGPVGDLHQATWFGQGVIAVTGLDERSLAPNGLDFVDTRTWTRQRIEEDATLVQRVGNDLMLAYGGLGAGGISAYDREGRERYRLFAGKPVYRVVVRGDARAYVHAANRLYAFQVTTGRILGSVPAPRFLEILG